MTLSIRDATADDVLAFVPNIANQPLFVTYGLSAALLQNRLLGALENDSLKIAVDLSNPKGILGLCWFLSHGTFATGAYLRLLVVSSSCQLQGIGTALLKVYEQAVDTQQSTGGFFLLTSDFNTDAQKFYIKHGYREVGALPNFAKQGITEKIFWKTRVT